MSACPTAHSPIEASPSCLSQFLPACEHENMGVPTLFRSGVLPVTTSVLAVWGPRSRAWGIPLLLLLLGGPGLGAAAVTLFPHGASQGDSSLPRAEEVMSPKIPLPGPFTLENEQFSSVFIYDDGWMTLNNSAPHGYFDLYQMLTVPAIGVYCAYVDLTLGGSVTYRLVQNPNLTSFNDVLPPNFSPAWALVITWFDIRSKPAPNKTNTYQVLMTSDGSRSELLFLYDAVTWYDDRNSPGSAFPWAGYTTGNGGFLALNASRTTRLLDLDTQSNIGKPGFFVFHFGTVPETSTTASSTAPSTTTASSTEAITTASSTEATTTASSTEATTTASSTVATTTASSTEGTTAASSTDGTTTASSTEATTTASSTEASTTASSTEATTTASSTETTTTESPTEATTTASSTEGTTAASSSVSTTVMASSAGSITTSSSVGTNTERSSGSGESWVGLLLTAHFIAVVIAGILVLLVTIALVAISWGRCFPKAKRKLDTRVSPVISV